ncbi:hypothetical protein Mgra_00005145 [Meloidogyne graminicola]|nr:hypothetical protein Mgra_00005145 [Meloidogyne graminicola]
MHCRKNPQWGCEQYTDVNGGRKFYCCPQLCADSAQTRILIDNTPKCSNGICQSDRTKTCIHTSTGEDYCCPPSQGGGTSGGGGGTSGGTQIGDCTDKKDNCNDLADLCIIIYSYEGMYRDCPKTCNVCGECQDLGTDCSDRQKTGYCDRQIYFDLMKWQCKKSCNFCNNTQTPRGLPVG